MVNNRLLLNFNIGSPNPYTVGATSTILIGVTGYSSSVTILLPSPITDNTPNSYIIADEGGGVQAGTYIYIKGAESYVTFNNSTQIIINTTYGSAWTYSIPGTTGYQVLFTR